MTAADLELSFLCWSAIPWSLTLIFLVLLYRYTPAADLYSRIFAVIYTRFLVPPPLADSDPNEHKVKLFEDLGNFKSRDWQLRNEGLIRILEIGSGPGANFQYYPKNCRLVCYDPNPHFQKYLLETSSRYPEMNLERYVVAGGENLIGTPDNSVDVVVTTLVNCTVNDVDQVLKEIKRVLAPEGRYYFLEHVTAPKGTAAYKLQKLLNPLWKLIFCGCDLQFEVDKALERAGFTNVQMESFIPKIPPPFKYVLQDHVMGIATK